MTSADRVAVVGTGLIGTSIAMAAIRAGDAVRGFDADPQKLAGSVERAGLSPASTLEECVRGATIVLLCTPVPSIPQLAAEALTLAPDAVVTDVGSVKSQVMAEVRSKVDPEGLRRFVGGHPMGGSERSGPEWASASVVDDIVWVLTPAPEADETRVARLEAWVGRIGARPVRMDAERHDRLVAIVSHLPQVASTSLMGLAATEEADEPEILLLAAGGFRDLTRLAASQPALWSDILIANRDQVASAIELFAQRLLALRGQILAGDAGAVEGVFDGAKRARLGLATKPTVRSGVAVWQVEIPDEPGALARITAVLGQGHVNIEDLQIVHSPEGGRGTVHLTVGAASAASCAEVLAGGGYDPIRLA